jgi:tetratricopeptide (TPR) repeat protein
MNFYPLLFEGVADKYAEKEFYIPDKTRSQEKNVNRQYLKDRNKVVIQTPLSIIVKNPTTLQHFDNDVRAIFSKEGNLYVANNEDIVHSLMIEYLEMAKEITSQYNWWYANPKQFFTLVRVKNTNKFVIGESNDTVNPYTSEAAREHYMMPYYEEAVEAFQVFIDKANKLFPQFVFINKHIVEC